MTTLARDLSHLPADHRSWAPDEHPRFAPLLAEAWRAENEADFAREKRFDTKMRVSKVGQCSRSTGYEITDTPRTEPLTLADHWRLGLGRLVHEQIEPVLAKAFPGASIEYPVDCRLDEQYPVDMSGSGDVSLTYVVSRNPLFFPEEGIGEPFVDDEGHEVQEAQLHYKRVVIEVKTINGFGFKMLVGARGKGEGPKHAHVVQGAVQARSEDADELVILYLSLELLSPREAEKLGTDDVGRFIAEYTIPRETWGPIAEVELRRQQKIIGMCENGELPPRSIPGLPAQARVVDPMHSSSGGRWEHRTPDGKTIVVSGECWNCAYCGWRTQCNGDGPS